MRGEEEECKEVRMDPWLREMAVRDKNNVQKKVVEGNIRGGYRVTRV
jgi:hypothetical protein